MLMGMATPANNHKNVNPIDYGPRAILAPTRLSSFEIKHNTTVYFLKNVFVGLVSRCLFLN
jgi:hypothetical protein